MATAGGGVFSLLESGRELFSALYVYILIGVISVLIYKQLIKPMISPLRKIPHLRFIPVIGNIIDIIKMESIDPYVKWIEELNTDVFAYYQFFGKIRLMVANPDFLKHILVTHCKDYPRPLTRGPSAIVPKLQMIIGDGLITSNGEHHMMQRKICNPSFKISVLKNMVPEFQHYSEKLRDKWMGCVAEGAGEKEFVEIEVINNLTNLTLDVIGKCAFGYEFNSIDSPNQTLVSCFQSMLSGFGLTWKVFLPFLDKLPSQEKRTFDANIEIINNLVYGIIEQKRSQISEITDESSVKDLLMSLLLVREEETGLGLTEKELRDQVLTFMLAGHETSSVTLSWCLLSLASNPETQQKLRDEIFSVIPDKNVPITTETLDAMPYLNGVVKETLRLYPPLPMTFRLASKDDYINGVFIPKGTLLNLQIGAMHRNPAHWDDPLAFKPERFLDETSIKPWTYLPFIAGPHMCIGYRLALFEMKVALAVIIREIKFMRIPGTYYKKQQRITMRPNPALKLRLAKV